MFTSDIYKNCFRTPPGKARNILKGVLWGAEPSGAGTGTQTALIKVKGGIV